MENEFSVSSLLLEKYGDWESAACAAGFGRTVIETMESRPGILRLWTFRRVAHALGMSTAELVQLVMDD